MRIRLRNCRLRWCRSSNLVTRSHILLNNMPCLATMFTNRSALFWIWFTDITLRANAVLLLNAIVGSVLLPKCTTIPLYCSSCKTNEKTLFIGGKASRRRICPRMFEKIIKAPSEIAKHIHVDDISLIYNLTAQCIMDDNWLISPSSLLI